MDAMGYVNVLLDVTGCLIEIVMLDISWARRVAREEQGIRSSRLSDIVWYIYLYTFIYQTDMQKQPKCIVWIGNDMLFAGSTEGWYFLLRKTC